MQEAVNDSLKLLKLNFFSFIANLMEPYLHAYQTDKPMIHCLMALRKAIKEPVEVFIKPDGTH